MAELGKPNTRLRWDELPLPVRSWVASVLGERVVAAVSQAGAFSPGSADRITGESGTRLFAKSVSRTLNRGSYDLFRIEVEVWAALGGLGLPAPAFRGVAESGEWITLVFDDVDGREPGGDPSDIAAVFAALDRLPDISAVPIELPAPPRGAEREAGPKLARFAGAWPKLLAHGGSAFPDRAQPHLSDLSALAAEARARGGRRQARASRPSL